MRIILAIALSLTASRAFAYCNNSPFGEAYGILRVSLEAEHAAKKALDDYREETNRRVEALEREQRWSEMQHSIGMEQARRELEWQQAQQERELDRRWNQRKHCPDRIKIFPTNY